jgi:putative ABC transport system substrate-binding protein
MKRREFIRLLGSAAAAWPLAAHAQQAGRIARVGVLGPDLNNSVSGPGYQVFLSELRKLGFTEGQNLVLEYRRTDEGMPKAFTGANEMVAAKADVLVANGPEISLQAATAARPAVPIVMLANNYDPFARGYVKSLAQPGGNITGLYYRQPELAVKQLELLVEAFPERTQVAILWDPVSADQLSAIERAKQSMRLSLRSLKLENPPYDFDAVFRTVVRGEAQMLHVLSSPAFNPNAHTSRNSRSGIACQQCSSSELTSRRADSCLMAWIQGPCGAAPPPTSLRFCGGRSRPICRSSKPRISSLPSI